MADPTTAGGGTEGLREALETEIVAVLLDGGAISPRAFANRLLAGPLARASAEQARVEAERNRLLIAFHDAIRRPLGVTPDSGAEFYDQRMADEAEERRAAGTRRIPHAQ